MGGSLLSGDKGATQHQSRVGSSRALLRNAASSKSGLEGAPTPNLTITAWPQDVPRCLRTVSVPALPTAHARPVTLPLLLRDTRDLPGPPTSGELPRVRDSRAATGLKADSCGEASRHQSTFPIPLWALGGDD